jgi:hypothetical protein
MKAPDAQGSSEVDEFLGVELQQICGGHEQASKG